MLEALGLLLCVSLVVLPPWAGTACPWGLRDKVTHWRGYLELLLPWGLEDRDGRKALQELSASSRALLHQGSF